MSVKRYVLDENALMGGMEMFEDDEGDYVLHSDYAALLARHNALVEAVAWERECNDASESVYDENGAKYDGEVEFENILSAARAEVDRLIREGEG